MPALALDNLQARPDAAGAGLAAFSPGFRRFPPGTLRPVGTPGLSLLVLYCTDLDGCRRFYTALGLDFSPEQHGQGPGHWAAVLAGGTVLELYPA